MKATIYPNLLFDQSGSGNPYIRDFIAALEKAGVQVVNPPHKNPLFSICFKRIDSDFYFFHWIEDVANNKFGYLQAAMAFVFLLRIKLCKKKIIWFLHNKKGHVTKHPRIRKRLTRTLTRWSSHIITHATDGLDVIDPPFRGKVVFIDHPTKNRMAGTENSAATLPAFDLLIWGTISRYKGVLEFLQFARRTNSGLKIRIVGRCNDKQLLEEIETEQTPFTQFENRSISFDELSSYIQHAKFVLIPYAAESILSSGVLMDSLSFGAKVIGPHVGSFKDYASSTEIDVHTFDIFEDIEYIVCSKEDPVSVKGYNNFLQRNSWDNFAGMLLSIIQK